MTGRVNKRMQERLAELNAQAEAKAKSNYVDLTMDETTPQPTRNYWYGNNFYDIPAQGTDYAVISENDSLQFISDVMSDGCGRRYLLDE